MSRACWFLPCWLFVLLTNTIWAAPEPNGFALRPSSQAAEVPPWARPGQIRYAAL